MKMNSPPDSSRRLSGRGVTDVDRLERGVAVRGRHLGPEEHLDVLPGGELVDEVARHALLQVGAAVEDGHAPRVGREEDRRLAGRVARTDDLDVQAVGVRRLAACGAVEDPLARETVEPLDLELPPGDTAGEDDRPRLQDVAAVEVDLVRRGVDSRDRPCDDDLGAEPARLLERPARQLVARHARREAEVVLDPRRGARLASRRLALDASVRAPRRRRTRRRPGRRGRRRRSPCRIPRPPARSRSRGARPPAAAAAARPSCRCRREGPGSRPRPAARPPTAPRRRARRAGATEADLVPVEEAPQLRAGRIPAISEHDRAERRGLGQARPQTPVPAEPVLASADPLPDLRRDGGEGAVVVRLEPEDAGGLRRPVPGGLGHPERDRQLADDVAGPPLADDALHAVDELTTSIRPSSMPNSARPSPSCAAYSPGSSVMSAAARQSRSQSAGARAANTANRPISSGVTMRAVAAGQSRPHSGPSRRPPPRQRPGQAPASSPSPRGQRYSAGWRTAYR